MTNFVQDKFPVKLDKDEQEFFVYTCKQLGLVGRLQPEPELEAIFRVFFVAGRSFVAAAEIMEENEKLCQWWDQLDLDDEYINDDTEDTK